MPIVYVHGVATRTDQSAYTPRWERIKQSLRTFIAPCLAPDPEQVAILDAYWGDVGVGLAWAGLSRPSEAHVVWQNHPIVQSLATQPLSGLMNEIVKRGVDLPGHLATRSTDGLRTQLNAYISLFLGDIFTYLAYRGTPQQPGAIPLRVLGVLEEAARIQQQRPGEPLVVLSHSMGGQIIYDIITSFLPTLPQFATVHIDFWCATASQIGLFEEMKLFLASDRAYGPGNPVPFPDRQWLTSWWNVWDPTDFLSFTVRSIIAEVDDDFYDSGLSLAEAHSGYLERTSFYSLFATKLVTALNAPKQAITDQRLAPDIVHILQLLQAVPGMTSAHLRDFHRSQRFVLFANGYALHTWANPLNVLHVFLADPQGVCFYGGFVGWIDRGYLTKLLEELKQRYG